MTQASKVSDTIVNMGKDFDEKVNVNSEVMSVRSGRTVVHAQNTNYNESQSKF